MSGLLLALLLACGGSEPPDADAEAPAEAEPVQARVLDDEAYRFCHEPGVFSDESQEWCDLLRDLPEEQCPGLRETCAGAPAEAASGCDEGSGGQAGRSPAGAPNRPKKKPWRPDACELPDTPTAGLAALVRWVVALAVALFILGVLRALWRFFGSRSLPQVEPAGVEILEAEPEEEIEGVPDLPSFDLLSAARSAQAEGDFGRAVVLARGAALRRLGDQGKVRLHRSRTDREYARAVRREVQLHGWLREVLDAVEVFRWGGAPLDRERSEAAVAAADRILKAVVAVVLVLGLGLGDAQAEDERYGPYGDAALLEVLDAWGHDAGFRLRGLDSLDHEVDVLVLDTSWLNPDEAGWELLRTWVSEGGTLVVAGTAPIVDLGERVEVETGAPVEGSELLAELWLPTPRWPDGPRFAWTHHLGDTWVRVLPDQGQEAMVDDRAVVVAVPLGDGQVLGIADARLLWNGAFIDPDNEQFVGDALNAAQGSLGWGHQTPLRIELATTAASESPSPSSSILNADLLPFVIQMMITWAILALWMGWPFGPLKDPPEAGRLSFSDHVRALGTRWQRLGASRYALAAYGGLWLHRLGPSGIRQAAIRAGRDKTRADALVTALQGAVEDPRGGDSAHDLEWMEELWTITQNR